MTKVLITVSELFNSSAHQLFCRSLVTSHCLHCPLPPRDRVITLVAPEGTITFCPNTVINRLKHLILTSACLTMFNHSTVFAALAFVQLLNKFIVIAIFFVYLT